MSGQDQAAGLRKWANLQRQQQEGDVEPRLLASCRDEETVTDHQAASAEVDTVTNGLTSVLPTPVPLVVVGLPAHQRQVKIVNERLAQWAALGRRWAGAPSDWDILVVDAATADLPALAIQHARWALWVSSDAEAFIHMYRVLRLTHDRGGPKRLLALHEPRLPRQGMLANLREAAASYFDIELLLLAR